MTSATPTPAPASPPDSNSATPPDLPPPTLPFITSHLPHSSSLAALPPPPLPAPKSPAQKMTRLSDFEKGQIAALWEEHKSVTTIQRRLSEWGQRRPYNTIKSFVDRWTARGKDYSNVRASGRPVKVGREERERIRDEVRRRGEGASWVQLQREVAPGISLRTLKRVVRGEYDEAEDGEPGGKGKKKDAAPAAKRTKPKQSEVGEAVMTFSTPISAEGGMAFLTETGQGEGLFLEGHGTSAFS